MDLTEDEKFSFESIQQMIHEDLELQECLLHLASV